MENQFYTDDKYILVGHTVTPCHNLMTWARWIEAAKRHVGEDSINGYRISTVFLGLDHRFFGEGPPVVFETMVFNEKKKGIVLQERYSTFLEAAEAHYDYVQDFRTWPHALTTRICNWIDNLGFKTIKEII